MGFTDIFKIKEYKDKISTLTSEVEKLNSVMTPELQDVLTLRKTISDLKEQSAKLTNENSTLKKSLTDFNKQIDEKKSQIIELDEEILFQNVALYTPQYDFANSEEYKTKLDNIRNKQKQMIKENTAVTGSLTWTVNGNAAQGKKMVKDMQKLLLRAFNSECDELISKVKYNTFDTAKRRITSSCEAISKLGNIMDVAITRDYYNLKIKELRLALEYRQKKQEEKELQKELRAKMREEEKLQKEIEAERKKIQKEQTHYQNALNTLLSQIETSSPEQMAVLLQKKEEIENKLSDIQKAVEDIDYREANQRAGYVYIISNIGSFGENVYKIGMTRRLDPMERVSELGDASVPFNFDVHAIIFSEDAPQLESALHKAFENKKLNMINQRREFFNVTLDEIKQVIKANFDKTVEFIDFADAEQYRLSKKMREQTGN